MKQFLAATVMVTSMLSGLASAAEPIMMNDDEMDAITAGWSWSISASASGNASGLLAAAASGAAIAVDGSAHSVANVNIRFNFGAH